MPRLLRLVGLALLLVPAAAQSVAAQGVTFVGTVVDAETGEPLPGATALVLGQAGGTVSNPDGGFRLTLPALPVTIIVRFVGFATSQTAVTAADVRDGVVRRTVRLSAEPATLGEAVVTSEPPGEKLWRRVLARRALRRGVALLASGALQPPLALSGVAE